MPGAAARRHGRRREPRSRPAALRRARVSNSVEQRQGPHRADHHRADDPDRDLRSADRASLADRHDVPAVPEPEWLELVRHDRQRSGRLLPDGVRRPGLAARRTGGRCRRDDRRRHARAHRRLPAGAGRRGPQLRHEPGARHPRPAADDHPGGVPAEPFGLDDHPRRRVHQLGDRRPGHPQPGRHPAHARLRHVGAVLRRAALPRRVPGDPAQHDVARRRQLLRRRHGGRHGRGEPRVPRPRRSQHGELGHDPLLRPATELAADRPVAAGVRARSRDRVARHRLHARQLRRRRAVQPETAGRSDGDTATAERLAAGAHTGDAAPPTRDAAPRRCSRRRASTSSTSRPAAYASGRFATST